MSDGNWKEKYLQKLDQFETSKKDWAGFEEFLRQTSSRLALAAEGGSKVLDEKLYALRKAIRKGESETKLTMIMDGVSTELVRLDKINANKPKGHAGFLSSLVDNLSLSDDMQKKSKAIRKFLRSKKEIDSEKLAKEFSQFFDHCMSISYKNGIAGEEGNSGDGKGGFFSRIFSSKDKDAEKLNETPHASSDEVSASQSQSPINDGNREAIEKSVTESLHNILDSFVESLDYPEEQKVLLREKLFAIKPTKEVHILLGDLAEMIRESNHSIIGENNVSISLEEKDSSKTHEILIHLLEAIPMQEDMLKCAEKLKIDFAKGISQKELPAALDSIADLIALMQKKTSQENKKFQDFLIDMTGRLQDFDQFLLSDLDEHKDSWEQGMALGNAVKEQVKGIGDSVSGATDLKQLERNIQSRLDKILLHVDEHKKHESIRVKRIQQQNTTLKDKVSILESESDTLREKIASSQEKAYTDPLTNLPNRLSYDQHLEELFARWERYHENLLLVIWDIDFFKKVNDGFGHQAGDEVLKVVAQLLRDHLRKPDFIARFGGEEFVSLLPNTSLGAGYKVAEKMREAIQDLEFKYKDQLIPLTISCGISLFASGDKSEDVFDRADKALYQAKNQGRNRCIIAQN